MGFFDRFTAKKPAPIPASPPPPSESPVEASSPSAAAAVKPRLAAAREKLEANDLAGAIAIYEEVLTVAGDRADVLVTISGDLGTHGHVAEIVEHIAPRYDAERHGPATGLNLLQAYLAVRNPDAAQHVLDILFGLNRPELEERLYGFSNAIAEMLISRNKAPSDVAEGGAAPAVAKVGLITISKPVWSYGLEPLAKDLFPAKPGKLRRIAFAQLALPGYEGINEAINRPDDELVRLSRALPIWLAETFFYSPHYAPVAALGIITPPELTTRFMIFGAEWTTDNLRQLVDTTDGGLDYIFTGALRSVAGDYELVLRVYEVKSFRERKKLTARWTPATANTELANLHGEIRRFMEWSAAGSGLAYAAPVSPRDWLETLGASVGTFVVEKGIVAAEFIRPVAEDLAAAAANASTGEAASLAYLTLQARAKKLGVAPVPAELVSSPLVEQAKQICG